MRTLGLCTLCALLATGASAQRLCEEQKLPGLEAAGWSVGIDGPIAVVGAPEPTTGPGAVHVWFEASDGEWVEMQVLRAADGEFSDQFGYSVLIVGETIFVGAPFADEGSLNDAGVVYVFEPDGSGAWEEAARLTASDVTADARFGHSLASEAGQLFVGAPGANGVTVRAGVVHGFEFQGNQWLRTDRVVAPDGASDDGFGFSVAISESRLVIGAPFRGFADGGGVYSFRKTSDQWGFDQFLLNSNQTDGNFGYSVSCNQRWLCVGHPGVFPKDYGGVVWYHYRDTIDGPWLGGMVGQFAPDARDDRFGIAVLAAPENNNLTLASGADLDSSNNSRGQIQASTMGSTGARGVDRLVPSDRNPFGNENFGRSLHADVLHLIVGAPNIGGTTGSAYIYAMGEVCAQSALLYEEWIGPGQQTSGRLKDLYDRDGRSVRGRSRIDFSSSEPNLLALRATGLTRFPGAGRLNVRVRSRISTPGGQASIWLRHRRTNTFDNVLSYPIGTAWNTSSVSVAGDPYIGENGNPHFMIRHIVVVNFSLSPFNSFFDLVSATVE